MRYSATILKVFVYLIMLVVACVLGYQFGRFSGIGLSNSKLTPVVARVTYDFASRQEYERLMASGLCTPDVITILKKFESEYGRIHSFKISSVHTGPFGIPISVVLHVERSRGRSEETLICATFTQFDQLSYHAMQ